MPRLPDSRIPGIRISGNPGSLYIRISENQVAQNQDLRIPGFPKLRVPGYLDFQKSEHPNPGFPESGHPDDTRISGNPGLRKP